MPDTALHPVFQTALAPFMPQAAADPRTARIATVSASIIQALDDAERPPITADLAQRTATWITAWADLDTAYQLAVEFGSPVKPDVKGCMIAFMAALGEVGRPDRIADRMRMEAQYRRDDVETINATRADYQATYDRLIAEEREAEAAAFYLPAIMASAARASEALSEAEALERRADQIAARPLAVAHG